MLRRHARQWVIIAIGLLLAACAPAGGAPTVAPTVSVANSAATRPAATRPPTISATARVTRLAIAPSATPSTDDAGCNIPVVTDVVARFLDAYNAGDQARLLAFFPARAATRGHLVPGEETYFQRYWDVRKPTQRDEDGFAAYARDELPPYWAQRHAQHERLQLLRFQECGLDGNGTVGFVFKLARQADDLAPHRVLGKAEIDGDRGTIVLWSMGPQEQPATPPRP